MLGKEVINDKPLTGEAAQMVREEAKRVLEERNKENITNMTKEEAKHLSEVLKAYSEGKKIEVKDYDGEWVDEREDTWYAPNAITNPMCYRIKPEPKLRPYTNAIEFLNAQKEHGPYYIQIDLKNNPFYMKPGCVTNGGFYTYNNIICTYSEFLQMFEWQDGTPCGVVE